MKLHLPFVARHRAFAARFARAGVRSPLRLRPLMPVLLKRRTGAAAAGGSMSHVHAWTLALAPRIGITLVRQHAAVAQAWHLHRHAAPVTAVREGALLRERVTVLRTPPQRIERSVVRHESRVEAPAVRVLRTMRIERSSAYPHVSVVLPRQPSPVPASGGAGTADAAAPRTPASTRPGAAPSTLPMAARDALPPHELARVTDHVLAQLDRKVLSFRERFGAV